MEKGELRMYLFFFMTPRHVFSSTSELQYIQWNMFMPCSVFCALVLVDVTHMQTGDFAYWGNHTYCTNDDYVLLTTQQ